MGPGVSAALALARAAASPRPSPGLRPWPWLRLRPSPCGPRGALGGLEDGQELVPAGLHVRLPLRVARDGGLVQLLRQPSLRLLQELGPARGRGLGLGPGGLRPARLRRGRRGCGRAPVRLGGDPFAGRHEPFACGGIDRQRQHPPTVRGSGFEEPRSRQHPRPRHQRVDATPGRRQRRVRRLEPGTGLAQGPGGGGRLGALGPDPCAERSDGGAEIGPGRVVRQPVRAAGDATPGVAGRGRGSRDGGGHADQRGQHQDGGGAQARPTVKGNGHSSGSPAMACASSPRAGESA